MLLKFTTNDEQCLKTVRLTGPMLRAFAHSLEHESHSGAEWEGLSDAESRQLMDLFEEIGAVAYLQADREDAVSDEVSTAPGLSA